MTSHLTLTDIAKIGLFLDDPHGDGIRLDCVRNPSKARVAAISEVAGEPLLFGEDLIRNEYEARVRSCAFYKTGPRRGEMRDWIKRDLK